MALDEPFFAVIKLSHIPLLTCSYHSPIVLYNNRFVTAGKHITVTEIDVGLWEGGVVF